MEYLPYLLDGLVLAGILILAISGYKKGFIITALSFLPMLAALISIKFLTPYVGRFLRQTPLFASLTESIQKSLHLDTVIGEAAMQTQTEIIQNMNLPGFLKDSLLENNNPVIYNLLDVEGLQDYICGFLANVCVNIVSVILVFIAVFFAIKLLLKAMNLISKLPVLNFINRASGFLVGGARGICVVWLVCILLTFFQCNAKFQTFFTALAGSQVASFFYENNVLLYLILTIFT